VDNDFPLAAVGDHIVVEETAAMCDLFGFDFYETLKSDLVDYTGTPQWDPGTTYDLGDIVTDCGMVFESLTASNDLPPEDAAGWKEADKFNTACYNLLWPNLRGFLAYTVIRPALVHVTYKTGAAGATEKYEDPTGIRTVGNPGYARLSDEVDRGRVTRMRLLVDYVKREKDNCDFSGVLFLDCETPVQSGRTRKVFYR